MSYIKIITDNCSDLPLEVFDEQGIRGRKMVYQFNDGSTRRAFKEEVEIGNKVICLAVSGALSSTYQNMIEAKENVEKENPNAKIAVIDTMTASLAQGLLMSKKCSSCYNNN